MKVLVTGGAGYIGSITAKALEQRPVGHVANVDVPAPHEDLGPLRMAY